MDAIVFLRTTILDIILLHYQEIHHGTLIPTGLDHDRFVEPISYRSIQAFHLLDEAQMITLCSFC